MGTLPIDLSARAASSEFVEILRDVGVQPVENTILGNDLYFAVAPDAPREGLDHPVEVEMPHNLCGLPLGIRLADKIAVCDDAPFQQANVAREQHPLVFT